MRAKGLVSLTIFKGFSAAKFLIAKQAAAQSGVSAKVSTQNLLVAALAKLHLQLAGVDVVNACHIIRRPSALLISHPEQPSPLMVEAIPPQTSAIRPANISLRRRQFLFSHSNQANVH
jgi:hypothetical protein